MSASGPVHSLWSSIVAVLGRAFPNLVHYQKLTTNSPAAGMQGKFRSSVWDPPLIVSQMITMQCIYYTTLGLVSALVMLVIHNQPSLHYVFDTDVFHISAKVNQLVLVSHLLNSLLGAVALWMLAWRAKQCLDFACTLHLFHFMCCWIYTGHFPTSLMWWLVQLLCIILMVVTGEYLCFKSDMKDIPLVGSKADV
ncbi:LOW QUALITY PROTEIN: protein SYS1 homolog [Ciona intestinalis]